MNLLLLFKNLVAALKEAVAAPVHVTRLQTKYPTCHIYPGVYIDELSTLYGYNVIFANTSVVNSVIGSHSFIQKNSRVLNADIGKFCSISSRVSIGLGRHATSMVSSHPAFYSKSQPAAKTFSLTDDYVPFKRIQIGNDVWIGENVMVMDGVKIGNGAVIAMGSVVTGNVPDYAIVAGNPARVFMSRFDEDIKKRLLASRWWDKPDDWLQEHGATFSDPKKLLSVLEKTKCTNIHEVICPE